VRASGRTLVAEVFRAKKAVFLSWATRKMSSEQTSYFSSRSPTSNHSVGDFFRRHRRGASQLLDEGENWTVYAQKAFARVLRGQCAKSSLGLHEYINWFTGEVKNGLIFSFATGCRVQLQSVVGFYISV